MHNVKAEAPVREQGIREKSLMEPTAGAASHGRSADAFLSEIGSDLLAGAETLPVLNAEGRQIGALNRQLALETPLRQT